VFSFSSNTPKKVHTINEVIPIIKVMMVIRKFPRKRLAMAIVMKTKEKIK
tara:strand:+ start:496 stop:645 length:150 start_codon:yes stop_codon:yes gene_type:complete